MSLVELDIPSMKKIAVLGLGKVGALAAHLLAEADFDVTGVDLAADPNRFAFPINPMDVTDLASLRQLLGTVDAVLGSAPNQSSVRSHGPCPECDE